MKKIRYRYIIRYSYRDTYGSICNDEVSWFDSDEQTILNKGDMVEFYYNTAGRPKRGYINNVTYSFKQSPSHPGGVMMVIIGCELL